MGEDFFNIVHRNYFQIVFDIHGNFTQIFDVFCRNKHGFYLAALGLSFEPEGDIIDWPDSLEKTEALALQKEYREIEAWIDGHSVEEVLANNELNERGVDIEERLRELGRDLRKQKPKGIEKRLSQLIDA